MTTSVTVVACSNPRTQVTVEIRDKVAGGEDIVTENKLAPGATSVPYYATTSRSIVVREEDLTDEPAADALGVADVEALDAETVAELAAG